MTPTVAVVVLNWNGLNDTIACLESVGRLDYPSLLTIAVDNASTDGSAAAIAAHFPWAQLIQNEGNLGYAEGNNRGIERALELGADFVLVLNNDTLVHPDLVRVLVVIAERYPQAAILGPKIYHHDPPDLVHYAGALWDDSLASFRFRVGVDATGVAPTDLVSGSALFARTSMLRETGLFDPQFYLVWEEADLCYRARAAGFETLYVPQGRVWHKMSRSFADGPRGAHVTYYHWRNRLLWMERHLPVRRRVRVLASVVWPQTLGQLRTLLSHGTHAGERRAARAALHGTLHYLMRRFGPGPAWLRARSAGVPARVPSLQTTHARGEAR